MPKLIFACLTHTASTLDHDESQVNALLERIKLQQAGVVEPPPLAFSTAPVDDLESTYGDWLEAEDLDAQLEREAGDEEEDEEALQELLDEFQDRLDEAEEGFFDDDDDGDIGAAPVADGGHRRHRKR